MSVDTIKQILSQRNVLEKQEHDKRPSPSLTERHNRRLTALINKSSASPSECLEIHKSIIQQEYSRSQLPQERDASLRKAWNMVAGAKLTVNLLEKSPQKYMKQVEIQFASRKFQIRGLPKDAMRVFCESQIARLTNELKGQVSESRVNYLYAQRSLTMRARKQYSQMQKLAMAKSKVKLPELTRNTSLVL